MCQYVVEMYVRLLWLLSYILTLTILCLDQCQVRNGNCRLFSSASLSLAGDNSLVRKPKVMAVYGKSQFVMGVKLQDSV